GEGHARAERKAAQEQAASWIETKEKADGGRGVFFLAGTARPLAFASSYAAEVEAQRGQPGLEQRFGRAIGHLVVHRAAELGMGMAEHGDGARIFLGAAEQDGFERAGRRSDHELA